MGKSMTLQRKLEVLAKHFGWTFYSQGNPYGFPPGYDCGVGQTIFNPLSDLNVAAICEQSFTEQQLLDYGYKLAAVTTPSMNCHWGRLVCATATHRFDAILKTLGLWKE